jgi:hypothetical protein
MPFLGPSLRRHQLRNFKFVSPLRNLGRIHLHYFIFPIVRRWHNNADKMPNVLSKVWSHAVANRASQFIVEKITAINRPNIFRMAVVHEVEMVGSAVT